MVVHPRDVTRGERVNLFSAQATIRISVKRILFGEIIAKKITR